MIVPHTVGDGYITEPVGTGPYMFDEWVRDSHLSVVANPNYWIGKPNIDRVVFRVIGDESARVSALRAGEIDIATMVPVHEIPALEAAPNIDVLSVLGTRSYFLEMNVNKPPFNDVRVRQAMNYAVDIDTLIEVLYEGRATRIPFVLSPQAFAYHDGLQFFEYNPEKAMQLLAEAGYPNGFEFELDVVDTHRSRAEIYQAMLSVVGINAKIRTWPTVSAMRDAWMQGKNKPVEEQRDALLTDWGNASLDPFDIVIPKFHSDASGLGRSNYSGYSNPEVDRLLESTLTSSSDEERRAAFLKAQEIIHADVPMVFEFVAHEIYGVRNRVKNFEPSPDGRLHLWAVDLE
jgi:peptide/nickel transport system substrate-binding protein